MTSPRRRASPGRRASPLYSGRCERCWACAGAATVGRANGSESAAAKGFPRRPCQGVSHRGPRRADGWLARSGARTKIPGGGGRRWLRAPRSFARVTPSATDNDSDAAQGDDNEDDDEDGRDMYSSATNSSFSSDTDNSQDSRMSAGGGSSSGGDYLALPPGAEVITPTTFVTLDGLNSGVPTRTTPTLTPTTLRNIEQTFIELQCEAESHQNEAGFVPPVVQPITQAGSTCMTVVDAKGWQGGITSVAQTQSRPSVVTAAPTIPTTASAPRRNMGGRRPAKTAGMSPEEEERRRVRRERNKMAAARCRKRRVDHTNALMEETEGLEQKKQGLQREIQQLQMEKEELEFLLEAHKPCCRLNNPDAPPSPVDVKPIVFQMNIDKLLVPVKRELGGLGIAAATVTTTATAATTPLTTPPPAKKLLLGSDATSGVKPSRPNSLPVAAAFIPSQNTLKASVSVSEVAGIPLTTPTSVLPFNFDSLMDGGTGLTPVSGPLVPSCSSQQRSSGCVDLSSPDSVPPKLVSL